MGKPDDVVRTATCRIFHGTDITTSAAIPVEDLTVRVGWLAAIVAEIGQAALDAAWTDFRLFVFNVGSAMNGRPVPSFAYKAMGATFGWQKLPAGLFASSRVVWMGVELAGRQLRSANYRADAVRELAPTVVGPRTCPKRIDLVTFRNTDRAMCKVVKAGGTRPATLVELEPIAPRIPELIPLAATDRQFSLTVVDRNCEPDGSRKAAIEMWLPTVARPASKKGWELVLLEFRIPAHYASADVRAPTLRIDDHGRLRADLSVAIDVPATGPSLLSDDLGSLPVVPGLVFGVDWGVGRLLTGALARITEIVTGTTTTHRVTVDGRPLFFDAAGLMAKTRGLRQEAEKCRAKATRLENLLKGCEDLILQARHDALILESERKDQRRSRLNKQLAQLAARWTVDQAIAAGAGIIALEDLRTMEHRGHGAKKNSAANSALRGQINKAIVAAAANAGLKVIIVPARGTSSTCGRCESKIRHRTAPNGPSGYKWALCPGCGLSADRDHSAAEHIAIRGALISLTRTHKRKPKTTVRLVRTRRAALTPPGRSRAKPARPAKTVPTRKRRDAQRQAACRPATPHPAWLGHRSAGPTPTNVHDPVDRQVRRTVVDTLPLEGLRWAYRTRLHATAVLYRQSREGGQEPFKSRTLN